MTWYQRAHFLKSAHKCSQLPEDAGVEVAFAGRSNAGKSSAINVICQQKGLCRTSKTPGRTQLINVFSLTDQQRLIDLPGYGFAKVPGTVRKHWEQELANYLLHRACLKGLIVLVDIRRGIQDLDRRLLDFAATAELSAYVLLTKCDKLKRGPAHAALHAASRQLTQDYNNAEAQLFSSVNADGVAQARKKLDHWLDRQPDQKR
jgi:GTP-binding protein